MACNQSFKEAVEMRRLNMEKERFWFEREERWFDLGSSWSVNENKMENWTMRKTILSSVSRI